MKPFAKLMGLFVLACALLVAPSAFAKHPVREIPVYTVLFNIDYDVANNFQWTNAELQDVAHDVGRQLDFANRVYANAGIMFTYDELHNPLGWPTLHWSQSIVLITSPDSAASFGCYGDDLWGDVAIGREMARDPDLNEGVVVLMPRYAAPPGVTCPRFCTAIDNACSFQYYKPDGAVQGDPGAWNCDLGLTPPGTPVNKGCCTVGGAQSNGPHCFTPDTCVWGECEGTAMGAIIMNPEPSRPAAPSNPLRQFAHEVGHYFDLVHAHGSTYGQRCYGPAQDDPCGDDDPRAPGSPGWCLGQPPSGGCSGASNPAWKNIMTYHTECQTSFGGETNWNGTEDEKWNSSLSPQQIAIAWYAIHNYYDKPTPWLGYNEFRLGGHESLYLTSNSGTKSATGWDGYGSGSVHISDGSVGDSGWTNGNVRIVLADVDGDGVLDAIVSTTTGSYPGTYYYRGGFTTELIGGVPWEVPMFERILALDTGATPTNSIVVTGNFMGDMSDDVLISRSTGAALYAGRRGNGPASTPTANLGITWMFWRPTMTVGNFDGAYPALHPVPNFTTTSAYQAAPRGSAIFDYDDLFVRRYDMGATAGWARVYRGGVDGFTAGNYIQAPVMTYNSFDVSAWAGNTLGEYHDELLVRSSNRGFEVFRGDTTFDFTDRYVYVDWPQLTNNVKVTFGNFSGDHFADLLLTTPSTAPSGQRGTKLWVGMAGANMFFWGAFHRTDLTSDITVPVAADFIRATFDDVVFTTYMGSFLYGGQAGSWGYETLIPDIWQGAYPSSSWVWWGRQ